jgi:deoxyribose-phosphate aldolase
MGKKNVEIEELKLSGKDERFASYCDHTVLRAYTTTACVREFCEEAIKYGVAAVCVNPIHVSLVKKCLKGTGIKTATVVGFPLGATKPSVKAFEASEAVKDGADEVDMVINVGALREGNHALVYEDIKGVVDAVGDKAIVKVIIETCYLSKEQKIEACKISAKAGAKFVKTSTGMGTGGATVKDVHLMKESAGSGVEVKASGGIEDRMTAYTMIAAGATRLGVSRVPQIVGDDTSIMSATKRNQPPKFSEDAEVLVTDGCPDDAVSAEYTAVRGINPSCCEYLLITADEYKSLVGGAIVSGGKEPESSCCSCSGSSVDLREKRLLHEGDLRNHNVRRGTVVLVSKKTIITTLAHDYAKSLGVKIFKEN